MQAATDLAPIRTVRPAITGTPSAGHVVTRFIESHAPSDTTSADCGNDESWVEAMLCGYASEPMLLEVIETLARTPAFDSTSLTTGRLDSVPARRMLRSSLSLTVGQFFSCLAAIAESQSRTVRRAWSRLSRAVNASEFRGWQLRELMREGELAGKYASLREELAREEPHAVYPTSPYRESEGSVAANGDHTEVEAVMTSRIATSIRVVDDVLDTNCPVLHDAYAPLGRCVCLIDENVEQAHGRRFVEYFAAHGIQLEKLVYRAMEVDKGASTVERMLGDFKQLGVSRNEPVLIAGGGVLSDTGGLACSLYHRGTPYVMLSTSLVAGVDAGPSPRTCCDGFGYKNLFGAYHPPILAITDRTFFRTLKPGWLRHGIAEIIKMATVKDELLFGDLEAAGGELIRTRFGSLGGDQETQSDALPRRILGRAIKSYVEAEYGNLYETHQCRPHAYGHTWSPGFEIPAGLLHGHAVSIGMGFGAYLAARSNWITEEDCRRVHRLIQSFELSLWHDVLDDHQLVWSAQQRMTEKRGGNLAAPLPTGQIGRCGYLDELTEAELSLALRDYRLLCGDQPNRGRGAEPLCSDVGLEDPSTVASSACTGC